MKRFLLYCYAFLLTSSLSAQTIDGWFDGKVSTGKMYLHHYPDLMGYKFEEMKIDSAPIVNGHFHFDFKAGAVPMYAKLLHANNAQETGETIYYGEIKLFLANDSIIIRTTDSLKEVRIFNSPVNYDYAILNEMADPYTRKVNMLNDKIYMQEVKTVPENILRSREYRRYNMKRTKLAGKERLEAYESFIKGNPYSWISLYALQNRIAYDNQSIISPAIAALYNSLGKKLKQSEPGVALGKRIAAKSKLYVGAKAPVFQLPDANGKQVSLAGYRGKYVLLEFWSSACGGCRAEAPHLKSAYEQYRNKGFEILSVSLDDMKYENRYGGRTGWLKAIEEDGTGKWRQISDLKGWKSAVAVLYDIQSIPQNYLIDPNGIIISENLRGADLHDKLEDLFW